MITAGGAVGVAFIAGALAGVAGGLYSRLFLIHGDTHIDPPAFAIFTVTSSSWCSSSSPARCRGHHGTRRGRPAGGDR